MSLANESKPGKNQYVDLLRKKCACYSLIVLDHIIGKVS